LQLGNQSKPGGTETEWYISASGVMMMLIHWVKT